MEPNAITSSFDTKLQFVSNMLLNFVIIILVTYFLSLYVFRICDFIKKRKARSEYNGSRSGNDGSRGGNDGSRSENDGSRVCVITYENRTNNSNFEKLKQINERYCKRHGYTYIYLNKHSSEDKYPPYWLKVIVTEEILMSGKFDYVMWIDSDACFHNHNITIPSLFKSNPNTFFAMARDHDRWSGEFNAGVWVVRNTKKGRDFMRDWKNRYNPNKWSNDNNKWYCSDCTWAGDEYEQGSGYTLMKDLKYSAYINKIDWRMLQDATPTNTSFTLHFAGEFKDNMKHYVQKYGIENL